MGDFHVQVCPSIPVIKGHTCATRTARFHSHPFQSQPGLASTYKNYGVLALCLVGTIATLSPEFAWAQSLEPIAAAGHGGFFGQDGRQIPLTLGFATKAQAWYCAKLLAELGVTQQREFAAYEKRQSHLRQLHL